MSGLFRRQNVTTFLVTSSMLINAVLCFNAPSSTISFFTERTNIKHGKANTPRKMIMDPHIASTAMESASTLLSNVPDISNSISSISSEISSVLPDFGSETIAFSDQGQNLAGIFFQASLLPYLIFLYFLGYKGNRTPALGNFGFQFLLLFVLSTIPSGIISKGNFGVTLADCDWLHGTAELLLTVTNVLIVSLTK